MVPGAGTIPTVDSDVMMGPVTVLLLLVVVVAPSHTVSLLSGR
jgi:hypothetical protein